MATGKRDGSITSDDEQARRLCALAVAFSNADAPIHSTEIHASHYAGLSDDSFRRKFSRDRARLVECGLAIRPVSSDAQGSFWQADQASFADKEAITAEDALVLDVLCSPLATDASFAYAGELRLALAKVDHAYGELTAVRVAAGEHGPSSLRDLLSCMHDGHVAHISYVDAQGQTSERDVAPYGVFGLRGHSYVVCAQVDEGSSVRDELRTFRDDRLVLVRRAAGTFRIPEDFSVGDHVRLPFQIGPLAHEATVLADARSDPDALLQLKAHAQALPDGTYRVSTSDVRAAGAWLVAAGMTPVAPRELVLAWRELLHEATSCKPTAIPAGLDTDAMEAAAPAKRRGRKGGGQETRELVALVGSLDTAGATLTPAAVAARLGVSVERARHLINLVLTACSDTNYQLPLGLLDDDGIYLSRSQGVTGHPVRLTREEARALVAALDTAGLPAEDGLRKDLLKAFGPAGMSEDEALPRVQAALLQGGDETLEACSRAIAGGAALSFGYQGSGQGMTARRRVNPQGVRHDAGRWYLDALDLDKGAMRTFRVDRMEDVRVMAGTTAQPAERACSHTREVRLSFSEPWVLDVLEWPRLKVEGARGGTCVASIPYYGGDWLPRRLAACGNAVSTDDAELAEAVARAAKELLATSDA